jgi:hypothetical protein
VPAAKTEISGEFLDIKSNFNERAINELESVFFYGDRWKNRIESLLNTRNHEILWIFNKLKTLSGVYHD